MTVGTGAEHVVGGRLRPARKRPLSLSNSVRGGWAAVATGAILRLAFLVVHPPDAHIYSDMAGYVGRAEALVAGMHLVPYDAFYPPGTHLLLALPLWVFGNGHPGLIAAGWLWWLLSSLIPLATWRLAACVVSPRAAVLATILAALDPLLITYGGFFSSEIPATAALLSSLWLGYRASLTAGRRSTFLWLAAGVIGGAAVVIRPQLILNVAVLGLALRPWRGKKLAMAAFASGLAAFAALGIAYSTAATGHLTAISENGGMNFFQTRCVVREVRLVVPPAQTYVFGSPVSVTLGRGTDYFYRGIEPGDQSFFYRQGLRCLTSDVPRELLDAARNVVDLTATSIPWPQLNETALARITDISNVIYCFVLISALLMLAYSRRSVTAGGRALLWQLATVLPVAIVFGGEPRFRLPYDPLGLILIAVAFDRVQLAFA